MTGDVLGSASIPLPRLVLERAVREPSDLGLRVIRFGGFELDLHAGELRKAGVRLSLPAQSFHVLALLLERPGDLVTREELRQRLWPTGTFVDFEHGLNAVVNRLRDTLGDSADRPRFIETVPRRGYRFIAPVDSGPKQGPAADPRPSVWRAGSLVRPTLVIALAMGAAVSLYVFWLRPVSRPPMRATPLTSLPGQERYPSFSPDGNQIAFAWDGANGDNQDIYIKVVGAGVPLRLTTHPAADQKPVWSSDGRHIAFVRLAEEGGGLFMIPALGGPERKIGAMIPEHEWAAGPSWSPDGQLLAFSEKPEAEGPLSIFLASIESQAKRKLTSPPVGSVGDCAPAISPDGRTVAFIRVSAAGGIFLVPVAGGEPTRVTREHNAFCERLAWTANGRELVFSTTRGAPESSSSLWRVSASGGTPQPVFVGGDNAANPALSRRGDRLAYEQRSQDFNIWQIEVPTATPPGRSTKKLIASTRGDAGPQFSPDGTRIAFVSDRTGSDEIWVCDTEGSNLVQLTSVGGPVAGTPRWSPDGRRIAFDGDWGIHVIAVDGGPSRRVASDTPDGVVPSWSRDGRWIYFASTRTGGLEVWKVPAAGGQAVQITKRGGFAAFESQDGNTLYYAKGIDVDGLWSVPVNGGDEAPVLDFPKGSFWGYWALVKTGIYYVNTETGAQPALQFLRFADKRVVQVAALDRRPVPFLPGMAVSPDERWVLYTQEDQRSSDIMLVENFR
jgi:Tol biopolymer transport system component/DNA-binding winged helix-turn-helix (wHTH) protein